MEYNIWPSRDKQYIVVKVKGDLTRVAALRQNIEAHTLGRRLGVRRYLVDLVESKNVDSILDDYEFAYHDMQNTPEIERSARVAMLVSPDDHSHDFILTASRNAGQDVTRFIDRREAIHYLLH